jgi:hypothetical protein
MDYILCRLAACYDFDGPINLRIVSRKDITEIGFEM